MTQSKQSRKSRAKALNKLIQSSDQATVELTEAALDEASGGAVFPSSPTLHTYKVESSISTDKMVPTLLLPAVQK